MRIAISQRRAANICTLLLSLSPIAHAASSDDTKPPSAGLDPCTIHSSLTGSFYDVRPLTLKSLTQSKAYGSNHSYHSQGYDYGANFTLNICGPVIEAENFTDVEGVPKSQHANISAYFTTQDAVYSLGQENHNLTLRGRKLLLNYTGGSPCPDLDEYGDPVSVNGLLNVREIIGGGGGNKSKSGSGNNSGRRSARTRSTVLSFICDTSPALSTTPRISFVGTMDHCTYNFEVRSRYACAGATPSHEKGTLGPAGVFGMIFGIAVFAYIVGGIVYNRNVMHQRGWSQLPNYRLWAGIWDFISVSGTSRTHRKTDFSRTCFRLFWDHVCVDCRVQDGCLIRREADMFE